MHGEMKLKKDIVKVKAEEEDKRTEERFENKKERVRVASSMGIL